MRLGTVTKRWTDSRGYECRQRVEAQVNCPVCGKPVDLLSETEEWRLSGDGRWLHNSYDLCPSGECCGKVLIFDGLAGRAFTLDPDKELKDPPTP